MDTVNKRDIDTHLAAWEQLHVTQMEQAKGFITAIQWDLSKKKMERNRTVALLRRIAKIYIDAAQEIEDME